VSVHVQGRRVAVLGRPLGDADVAALLELVAREPVGATPALELAVYDADGLPAPLVEALCEALDAGRAIKVLAYHGLLAQRLARLGVPVRQAARVAPRAPEQGLRALALAGSACSLDKIMAIVGALPRAGLAVFVAQHVLPDATNLLDQLLKTRTDYRVLLPQQLCPVEPGTIYVAPPDHHMKVAHGLVYLTRDRAVQFARPSIDVLFESVAAEYGAAALAVLLCGFGRDGTAGCAALHDAGATVFAEAGEDCGDARAMPDAARDAGHCDQVLALPALVSVVAAAAAGVAVDAAGPGPAAAATGDAPTPALLGLFLDALHAHSGQDLRGYQRDSLERRVRALMGQLGIARFSDFQRALFGGAQVLERFTAELPVGVTSFFRHPEQMRELREAVMPFLQSFPAVKLWCAGCATGEEAYSLAILLDEAGLTARSHLFATDMNPHALALARDGLYPAAALAEGERQYAAAGGARRLADYVEPRGRLARVTRRLAGQVLFYRHSLTEDGVFNEFQLIVCRNVMIYFGQELQRRVLQRFAQSLHADGLLVLGPQDGMTMTARDCGFAPLRPGSHIYRLQARSTGS